MVEFLHYAAFDSDLPIVLQVRDVEAKWFKEIPDNRHALEESGYWFRFLVSMINFSEKAGETCKIKWQSFFLRGSGMVHPISERSRCLEIVINDERIIITLTFRVGFGFNERERGRGVVFTVRCSNEKIIPLAILFGDEILG